MHTNTLDWFSYELPCLVSAQGFAGFLGFLLTSFSNGDKVDSSVGSRDLQGMKVER